MAKRKKVEVFDIINAIILSLLVIIFLIPFWIIITASFSENSQLVAGGVSVWFKGFSLDGYRFLFSISDVFINSIFLSIGVSVTTSIISMTVSMLAAYALSRKSLVGRDVIQRIFVVSMFFSGGMIPTYIWQINTIK